MLTTTAPPRSTSSVSNGSVSNGHRSVAFRGGIGDPTRQPTSQRSIGNAPMADADLPESDPAADEADLVKLFKLLADETRLRVLMSLLRERELNVTSICKRLDQSQPAVSHHLALLRGAGLIESRRDGKHNFYRVRREHFESVMGGLFTSILEETPAD